MLMSCEEVDLASLTWISYSEQLYTDAAFMLDASTRVTAFAGSCLIDVHLHCVVDGALESKVWRQPCSHAWSCEAVDLASLTLISYAEQLYTDTAFMLDVC